ncbi:hypothetical protein [Novosphingobium colocasiae]|uniref:hypothetical protein n=1 Tax=Novosphingobium colocasiae TaxID=1256513 RepID=UPI0035AEFE41
MSRLRGAGQKPVGPILANDLETGQKLKVLEKEGCDEARGYYFGRPTLPPSSIRRNRLQRTNFRPKRAKVRILRQPFFAGAATINC